MKYVGPILLLILGALLLTRRNHLFLDGLLFSVIGLLWLVRALSGKRRRAEKERQLAAGDGIVGKRKFAPRVVWLLVLFVSCGTFYYRVIRDPNPPPPRRYSVFLRVPNLYTGNYVNSDDEAKFTVSPDEHWLVYAAFRDGNAVYVDTLDIYLHDLRDGTSRRVAASVENEANVAERLARQFHEACWVEQGLAFRWSPSEYAQRYLAGRNFRVVIVPSECRVTEIETEEVQWSCPSFTERKRATRGRATNNSMELRAWNGDGPGHFIYKASRHGAVENRRVAILERIDTDGNAVELVHKESSRGGWEIENVSISPGERYVAYSAEEYSDWDIHALDPLGHRHFDVRLFILDTTTGKEYELGAVTDFFSATWTPDGNTLYFIERNEGFCRIKMAELKP